MIFMVATGQASDLSREQDELKDKYEALERGNSVPEKELTFYEKKLSQLNLCRKRYTGIVARLLFPLR